MVANEVFTTKGDRMNDKIIGRPIRCNRQKLKPNREGFASVVFIGDVHFGSPQCDVKRFLAMLAYCLKNRIYVMLMGDRLEVGTKASVGAGVYEQECNTDSQFEQMATWLKPLAEAKLIIGTLQGN